MGERWNLCAKTLGYNHLSIAQYEFGNVKSCTTTQGHGGNDGCIY